MIRRQKWLPAFLLCSVVLAGAGESSAQSSEPGRRAKSAKPAAAPRAAATPSPSGKPAGERPAAAEVSPAPTSDEAAAPVSTTPDELGEAPPRASGTATTGLSPLNPRPEEFPSLKPEAVTPNYDALLAEIAALRSRVAALTATLFRSRLSVVVETAGDEARIARFVVTLDDGVVYSAPEHFVAEDGKIVYEHAVAPGHHVLGIEIERYDSRDKRFRTWQTSRFSVIVPENKQLSTEILLEEDSDMGEDFPEDESGEYDLNVRLRAWVDS